MSNPIILQFPRFAGGKFISNCLSMSRHCVPQNKLLAEYLIDKPSDYQYRYFNIMRTLPPATDMTNWINKYELGDTQLFGKCHYDWRQGIPCSDNLIDKLYESDLNFFIVSHSGPDEILKINKVWPNSTVILLKNYQKFYEISAGLKSSKMEPIKDHAGNYCKESYNILKGSSWPLWEEYEANNYQTDHIEMHEYYHWHLVKNPIIAFDMDNTIFKEIEFLVAMESLYQQLGYSDFNAELISSFWKAYIRLHIDISK